MRGVVTFLIRQAKLLPMKPTLLLALFSFVLPLTAKGKAPTPEQPGANQQLRATLQTKTFAEVIFQDKSLAQCIAWMKEQGVPVEMSPAALEKTKDTRVTLTLHKVPAIETLKYLTNLTNTRYAIEDGKVTILPLE
jgi:hypothetical protein